VNAGATTTSTWSARGDLLRARPQLPGAARRERLLHQAAQPGVVRRVGAEQRVNARRLTAGFALDHANWLVQTLAEI
jgi:hypothetical protein